jgi:DNA-binding response OmpR family regulator
MRERHVEPPRRLSWLGTSRICTMNVRMAETRTRALVVEDDPAYARLLRLHLEANGYQVQHAVSGGAGLSALDSFGPEVVILDVMLPDMDGFEICRRIRETSNVPIMMLTNRAEERHKVQGLMLGADDYVTKPFSAPELLARLTSILRRARRRDRPEQTTLELGGITVDLSRNRAFHRGQPLALTATEFKLLTVLAETPGRVLVNDELLRRVWGSAYVGDATLLRTTIGRLRRKLGDAHSGLIQNVRGIGYSVETSAAPPG